MTQIRRVWKQENEKKKEDKTGGNWESKNEGEKEEGEDNSNVEK